MGEGDIYGVGGLILKTLKKCVIFRKFSRERNVKLMVEMPNRRP